MKFRSWLVAVLLPLMPVFFACDGESDNQPRSAQTAAVAAEPCPVCPVCPKAETPVQADTGDASPGAAEESGPDMVVLDHLTELYEPTRFNHANHVDYEEDCSVCHHHTSDAERFPPCRECHGMPFKTMDRPGLKGAYHRQCMNCHREMESGPLGCTDCHSAKSH